MPTYQYACTDCSHAFDQVQSFTDDSLTECPSCTGRLRKVFNAVGVVFKGSGFYRTDSRSGSAASDSSGASSSDSKDSKSTDSKSTDSKSKDAKSTTSDSSGSTAPAKASTSGQSASTGASAS